MSKSKSDKKPEAAKNADYSVDAKSTEADSDDGKKLFTFQELTATILSVLAIVISLTTLYLSNGAPYSLLIPPPSISQTNDELPSLLVDLTIYNSGSRSAIINEMRIRTANDGKEQKLVLHAQAELNRQQQIGTINLDNKETKRATFVAQVIRPNDIFHARFHFMPYQSALPVDINEVWGADTLLVDAKINGQWHKAIFELPYRDFNDKFKKDSVVVPEQGYAPRWFHDHPSFEASGSFWSNK
ncbi:hypothetical protein [Gimesia maris]|uniref:hypothetical protein n=1 Tax=Gimesia maris TaxID=122 RepID=UPI0032ED2BE9